MINNDDLNEIKRRPGLLVDEETSYISITERLISDMRGNSLVPIPANDAQQTVRFQNDSTRPHLVEFHLDMDASRLHLTFLETINASSINFTSFGLQADSLVIDERMQYYLTGGDLESYNASTVVSIIITLDDLNEIKARQIGTSTQTSWLVVESTGIMDQNDLPILPLINGVNALQANQYTIDTTRPQLEAFWFDLNSGELMFSFSETVRSRSLNITTITVQNTALSSGITNMYTLSELGTRLSPDGPIVTVRLTDFDLNEIKRRPLLATSMDTTFISVRSSTVFDMQMNYLIPIPNGAALQVRSVTPDVTPPMLVNFALDMDSANLTLTFDEAVNASSLDPSGITLSSPAENGTSYTLTGGFVISCFSTVVTMNLNDFDFDLLKINEFLCSGVEMNDCELNISSDSILDMSRVGNSMSSVEAGASMPLVSIIPDTTEPYLVYYDLNMTSEELRLTFSEVVRPESINVQDITLQATTFEFDALSNASVGANIDETDPQSYRGVLRSYTLSGTRGLSGPNQNWLHPPVVVISLTEKDLNLLKNLEFIATSAEDTYLLITSDSIRDYYDNPLTAIENSNGKRVRVYTPDRNRPRLNSFDFDLDSGELILTFSETVNRSSLETTGISLQGSVDLALSDLYTLTGGDSVSYDNPVILITLSIDDLNEVKRRTRIASEEATTYISISDSTVADQDANPVIEISSMNALPVRLGGFIPDTNSPQIVQFSLDMNTGRIHLTFNETINSSSLMIDTLSLTDNETSIDLTYTLSPGNLLTNDSTMLSYVLNINDLNEIKRINLCTFAAMGDDCFLITTNETILDMSGNHVVPREDGNAIQVDPYINDDTPPEIISFAVNMTLGNITLTFSETVNVSTFDPTGITLHEIGVPMASMYAYDLTGGNRVTTENGLTLEFYLNKDDLEFLRRDEVIYVSQASSFMSASPFTIEDMSRNPLNPLDYLGAESFVEDGLGPVIIGTTLDLSSETLQLTFSETVRAASFRPAVITIQNANNSLANATVAYTLTGGAFDSTVDSTVITINLTRTDILEILAREELAISPDTTYFLYTDDLVTDLADNAALPIDPLQVTNFIPDRVDPDFFSFLELDLAQRQLVVEFNEPVDLTTADATLFTLQEFPFNTGDEFAQAGVNITLTGGTFSYRDPGLNQKRVVVLSFNDEDYRRIVLQPRIGTEILNTYISLPIGAVYDIAGNPSVQIPSSNGTQVQRLIEDNTIPELINYDLDVDAGTLTLRFDNVMNPDTLDPTAITIQDAPMATFSHTLTGGFTGSDPDYSLIIDLTVEDLNEIKRITEIATERGNSYVTIAAELLDSYGGTLVPYEGGVGINLLAITDGSGLQVTNFTEDTTDPILVSFDLDLNSGELLLTFDETVNASSLDLTEILLQSTQESIENLTRELRLTLREDTGFRTTSTQDDSTVITVTLGFDDMNDIKRFTDIATDNSTTFISFINTTIFDMNNNPVVPIYPDNATQVLTFTEDTTSPTLVSYDLDVDMGFLYLTFDETVNVSSLYTPAIRLQSTPTGGEIVHLTELSAAISEDDYIVVIEIDIVDLNEIKRYQQLAQNRDSTYISFMSDAIRDMNDNSVNAISTFSAFQVTNHTADTTSPTLEVYHLDMDEGILYFTFDETVDVSTFMFDTIQLFSSMNATVAMLEMGIFTLTGGTQLTGDTHEPSVLLTLPDQYSIKLLTNLATSLNNTFLVIDMDTIDDMQVPPNSVNMLILPLPADNYTEDTTPPQVNSFSVDLNLGIISIIFDEPVNASSVNFDSFTLQSSNTGSPSMYRLTGGYTNSSDGRFINIIFSDDDLNNIKKIEDLYISRDTSYLRFDFDTIRDMADNEVIALASTEAIGASAYTDDMTRPALVGFDLDMTAEVLTLYFRETVDYLSLNVSAITFQQDFNITEFNESYRLTGGLVSPMDDTTLMVNLTTLDLNQLKRLKIGVSNFSTWLAIDEGAVLDQVGAPLLPRLNGMSAIPVSFYTPDTIHPELQEFILDLDGSGILWLTFSETVDASTFNSTQITLQNAMSRNSDPDTYFTLSADSQTYVYDLSIQRVSLSKADLDEIKRLFLLATDRSDTFISITTELVEDVFGNPVNEILPTFALPARDVISDITPPTLLLYQLNLTSELLVLTFSETVNASSLDLPSLQLIGKRPPQADTERFSLTTDSQILGGDPIGQDNTVITIQLGTLDLNRIKSFTNLAVNNETTFLSAETSLIADMSGNGLVAIPPISAQRVDDFYEDSVRPQLVQFDLDVDAGVLRLTFDETVNGSSLIPTEISLLGQPSNDSEYEHTLSGAQSVTPNFTTEITIQLLDSDLNEIKRQRSLAVNETTTFLSLTENTIVDMNNNPVVPLNMSEAMMVFEFTNDTTPPQLLSFDLDLTTEILTLTFDETVRVETLDVRQITIQDRVASSSDFYWSLRAGMVLSNDSTVVMIGLDNNDLNQIKIRPDVATFENNTYISVTGRFIQDMNENLNQPVSSMNPIPVSFFMEDLVHPILEAFDLDMDGSGLLTLFFSESVNVSTIDVTEITILVGIGNIDISYRFTSTSYSNSSNGPIVQILPSLYDLNRIKMIPQLAISQLTTYLSLTNSTILDMNDNPVVAVPPLEAQEVRNHTEDTTPPVLESFSLDMDDGLLTLNFSETVLGSNLNRARFTLQNNSTFTGVNLTLQSDPVPFLPLHFTLVVPLLTPELNELKRITTLATSTEDTWISVERGGVEDTSADANPLEPIPISDALQAVDFTSDTTKPQLTAFDIDLDAGTLTLIFEETVRARTLNVTQITLQDTAFGDGSNFYSLTGGTWRMEDDSTIIELTFSFFDLNQIKKIRDLASVPPSTPPMLSAFGPAPSSGLMSGSASGSASGILDPEADEVVIPFGNYDGNTFIVITPDAIQDMNSNPVVEIESSNATRVRNITLDTTSPELVSFDFNLDSEQILLTFTETVNVDPDSLLFQEFTILGSPMSENYTLVGGTTPSEDDYIIVIQLDITDVNNLKRNLNIAVSNESTILYLTERAIRDMNANQLNFSEPLQVINITIILQLATKHAH